MSSQCIVACAQSAVYSGMPTRVAARRTLEVVIVKFESGEGDDDHGRRPADNLILHLRHFDVYFFYEKSKVPCKTS